jgi:hypothetical protein
MRSDEAFRESGRVVQADPLVALLARWRRSVVIDAVKNRLDVEEVIPSGSLVRGTQLETIHDIVDLIVVFDESMRGGWGGGGSAGAALEYLQTAIRDVLQAGPGRPRGLVQGTELRNHVVTFNLDSSLGPLSAAIPDASPVNVMPAVRAGSHLRVPERASDRWIDVDPEPLLGVQAAQRRAWSNFDQVVQMIKGWAGHQGLRMTSFAIEVLVLKYLPRPDLSETMSSSDAIAGFFEAASRARIIRLSDPAARRAEIYPELNYAALRAALDKSAALARQAIVAEGTWQKRDLAQDSVAHPSVYWQEIFGQHSFRRPSAWYWNLQFPADQPSPPSRRWFDEHAEPADESVSSWKPWHHATRQQPAGPAGPPLDTPPTHALGRVVEPELAGPDKPEPASTETILDAHEQEVPRSELGGPLPRGPGAARRHDGGSEPRDPRDGDLGLGILQPDGPDRLTSVAREIVRNDDGRSRTMSGSALPISIYLSDERIHEDVEAAVDEWLAYADIAVEERDEPVIGSWFRRMRAGVRQAIHSPAAAEAALTAIHAADSRLVLAQDAMMTATLLQNLGPVIASLQPTKDAVLRVGALLIVKIDWVVQVHQLTAAQQAVLDHQPRLASSPREIISALQLSESSGTEAADGGVKK